MDTIINLLKDLIVFDIGAVIALAVTSGVGLAAITELLKTKWVKVPAKKYPRIVTAVLAVLVGIISTFATGIELSSLTSLIVFVIVAFVVSGLAYDGVKGLVGEVAETEGESTDILQVKRVADHESPRPDSPISIETTITSPDPAAKTAAEVAREIVDGVGDWGVREERIAKVEAAGLQYDDVHHYIKKLLAKRKSKR